MKFLSAILVILGLLGLTFGASISGTVSGNGLKFDGNVSISDTHKFRAVAFAVVPVINANLYTSIEVKGAGSSSSGSASGDASVDAIVGLSYLPGPILGTPVAPPTTWVAYFKADASGSVVGLDTNKISLDFNIAASASLAANVYHSLSEVKPDGTVHKLNLLSKRNWKAGTVKSQGELRYVTYTSDTDNYDVNVTLAVSGVTGRLSAGGAIITPRSMETVIEIGDYQYANAENKLVLNIFTAQLSAEASGSLVGTTLLAGKDKEQLYFHFDGSAEIDGKKASVQVTGLQDIGKLSELENSIFEGVLKTNAKLTSEVRKVKITFPAGAKTITYDPALGFAAPEALLNSSSFIMPSILALFISFLVFFVQF